MTGLQLWIAAHRHELDDIETAIAYGAAAGLADGLAQQALTPQALGLAVLTGVLRYLVALATKVKPPEPPPTPGSAGVAALQFPPPPGVTLASAGVTNPQPPAPPTG